MRLTRDDDTVQIDLHARECNRQDHHAHSETYTEQERQEDGLYHPVTHTREVAACETGEDWVRVKRRLSKGDVVAIAGAAVSFQIKVGPNGSAPSQEMEFGSTEYRNMNIAGLVVGVKEWNLQDKDGRPAPITRKYLEMLTNEDAELIAAKCNELWNPPRTDDERKNSSSPSAPPYETASLPLNNSGG